MDVHGGGDIDIEGPQGQIDVSGPDVDIRGPKVDVDLDVNGPDADIDAGGKGKGKFGFKMPHIGFGGGKHGEVDVQGGGDIDIEGPKGQINVSGPDVDISGPKVDVE